MRWQPGYPPRQCRTGESGRPYSPCAHMRMYGLLAGLATEPLGGWIRHGCRSVFPPPIGKLRSVLVSMTYMDFHNVDCLVMRVIFRTYLLGRLTRLAKKLGFTEASLGIDTCYYRASIASSSENGTIITYR